MSESPPKVRLIINDDDKNIRDTLARLAQKCSPQFATLVVETGDEAIRLLTAGGIDAVLTDFTTPGKSNGNDVIRAAKETGVKVFAIMTGWDKDKVEEGTVVLDKPCDMDELMIWLNYCVTAVMQDRALAAAASDDEHSQGHA